MVFLSEMDIHIHIKTKENLWLFSLQKHLKLKKKTLTENAAFHKTQETQVEKITYNPQYLYRKPQQPV